MTWGEMFAVLGVCLLVCAHMGFLPMKSWRLTEAELAVIKRKRSGQIPPFRNPVPKVDSAPDRWPLVLRDQIVEAGLPEPYREFTWHSTRNFRADLCWPQLRKMVEVDGGVHRVKDKWLRDVERHNLLAVEGWLYVRVTPDMVKSGEALRLARELLDAAN